MEDERPVVVDLDQLRQLFLGLLDVDKRVARVVEDAEEAVDANVDARRLEEPLVVRVDLDAALLEQAADRPVGEDHAAILRASYACASFRWLSRIGTLVTTSAGAGAGGRFGSGAWSRAACCSPWRPGSRSAHERSAARTTTRRQRSRGR